MSKARSASTSALSPVKHQLSELFWMIGCGFMRWSESQMHDQGLSPPRLRLLWVLLEKGPMIMSALRDKLGVTATNITALVDSLEKDGMVVRKSHPTDRRATLVALTARAEKSTTQTCALIKDHVSELFSVFNKAEQEQLLGYLQRIREALVERQILGEADDCGAKAQSAQKKESAQKESAQKKPSRKKRRS